MRVHIDATPLFNRNPRGIGSYIMNLVPRLCEAGVEVVAGFKLSRLQRFGKAKRIPPCAHKAILQYWRGKVELFHGTHRYLEKGDFAKVLTVHDMLEFYERRPFGVDMAAMDRMRRKTLRCLAMEPQAIIAVSGFAKTEISRFTDYPLDRVFVIHHGVPGWARPYSGPESQRAASRYGLRPGRYTVFVGEPEPRKNLALVLRAMALVPGVDLLVAGGTLEPGDARLASRLRIGSRVIQVPFVPGEELGALLSGSLALVFPSKYEGFGMPVLEGMASGAPTLISDHPALREVAGGCALEVHPEDHEALARALLRLGEDMPFRRELVQRGLARASEFSWEKTARKTLEVYRRALGV